MYLKSLTLRGFKSFAGSTTLQLEPGLTCVVGPNGSGKSNVVDAIAWVLGEQGAKALRGGKMEDVIFAGSPGRPPLGRAEVQLTIDNSDGALPDRIRRGHHRPADVPLRGVRVHDQRQLRAGSSTSRSCSPTAASAARCTSSSGRARSTRCSGARPEDRRGFVEEAAGVLKHRKRKERALRKLETTATSIERLTDLAAELRRQLGPLGRQAEAARRAGAVQAALRDARLRLLADDVVNARQGARGARRGRRRARPAARARPRSSCGRRQQPRSRSSRDVRRAPRAPKPPARSGTRSAGFPSAWRPCGRSPSSARATWATRSPCRRGVTRNSWRPRPRLRSRRRRSLAARAADARRAPGLGASVRAQRRRARAHRLGRAHPRRGPGGGRPPRGAGPADRLAGNGTGPPRGGGRRGRAARSRPPAAARRGPPSARTRGAASPRASWSGSTPPRWSSTPRIRAPRPGSRRPAPSSSAAIRAARGRAGAGRAPSPARDAWLHSLERDDGTAGILADPPAGVLGATADLIKVVPGRRGSDLCGARQPRRRPGRG